MQIFLFSTNKIADKFFWFAMNLHWDPVIYQNICALIGSAVSEHLCPDWFSRFYVSTYKPIAKL